MPIDTLRKKWIWLLAVTIVPVGAVAAPQWNFSREASRTMGDLASYAVDAALLGDELQAGLGSQELSYQSHAYLLAAIKDDVDAMGAKVCRLEEIKRSLPASQRKEIDETLPALSLMANHTGYAIRFLSGHPQELWSPAYASWVNALTGEAHQLSHNLGQYIEYAKVHRKDLRLERSLGISAGK